VVTDAAIADRPAKSRVGDAAIATLGTVRRPHLRDRPPRGPAGVQIPFVMDVTVVDDDTAFGTCSSGLDCGEGGVVRFTPDLGPLDGATTETYTKPISFHAGGQGVDVVFNGTQTVSYA